MPFDSEPAAEVTARDRMIRLRDFLATLPARRFDMDVPGYRHHLTDELLTTDCGTAACIGGWACRLWGLGDGLQEAADALGLTEAQASALFYPMGAGYDLTKGGRMGDGRPASLATPAQAVAVLDHFLATGVIDWSVAADQPAKREPEPAR